MDDLVKTVRDAYNQGYKQGHIDGIKHIRNSIIKFAEQVSETLIETTKEAITDKKGE